MYHGSESVNVNDMLKSEQEPERMRALYASLLEARTQHIFHDSAITDQEWQTWRRDLKDFALRLFE